MGRNRKLSAIVDAFDPFRGLQEAERQRALGLNVSGDDARYCPSVWL